MPGSSSPNCSETLNWASSEFAGLPAGLLLCAWGPARRGVYNRKLCSLGSAFPCRAIRSPWEYSTCAIIDAPLIGTPWKFLQVASFGSYDE
jgi:hypothetical protein